MIGLVSIEIATGSNAVIHTQSHDILVVDASIPLYHARVFMGRNIALRHGFNSVDAANEWARTIAKKIEKQHKELMKHEHQALQN